MFFSWFARNKHFKQGDNLSGQIFPFLLICIVGLLVAVGVTISAGKSAITKTCASNAVDAGSLAAASGWAGAFNELVTRNKEMKDYYLLNRSYYMILYNLAQGYLTDNSGDNALDYSKDTEELVRTEEYVNAAKQALESAECIQAFYVLTYYMQALTDNFKSNQTGNYCNSRFFMDQSIKEAKSTGLSYAFSNSCTESRTSGDSFNYWLGTGKFNDSSSYKWESGTQIDGKTPKYCGITVTLTQPEIATYKLIHTTWNYPEKKELKIGPIECITFPGRSYPEDPFNFRASLGLKEIMTTIKTFLEDNAEIEAEPKEELLRGLRDINTLSLEDNLSIPKLGELNKLIYNNVWQGSKISLSKTCDDVKSYVDDSKEKGMMIINIDEVILTKEWTTQCNVFIFCEDKYGKPGGTTSASKAQFDGGELRTFKDMYEARIINAS